MEIPEIKQKFDQIIDTPVKYYSSGMYVRLAFFVAAHLTPEILSIDEARAMSDARFHHKLMAKTKELLRSGAVMKPFTILPACYLTGQG